MFENYLRKLNETRKNHPVLFYTGLGFYLVFLAVCVYIDLKLYGIIKSK